MSCRVRQIPAQSRLCQPYAVSFRASCLTSLSLENIHCNTEIILYRLLGCWWEERTWKDQYVYVCTQLSPILCDPTDSSPPGSSVQGFSRQEYWSGLLSPIPGDLPAPGTEPQSPVSSVLADGFFFLPRSYLINHWTSVRLPLLMGRVEDWSPAPRSISDSPHLTVQNVSPYYCTVWVSFLPNKLKIRSDGFPF